MMDPMGCPLARLAACGVEVIALGGLALVTPAQAQNVDAPGRHGQVSLQGDFQPDPHVVQVEAGGPDSASGLGTNCGGFITNAQPDFKLEYTSPSTYPLGFFVVGSVDTTLVINDPSGHWFCNDDFSEQGGANPGVVFPNPAPTGVYDIWVGVYEPKATGAMVDLRITESGPPWEPVYGVAELSANFSPDPHVVEIRAGGRDTASVLASGCTGFVNAARPDYGIAYANAGQFMFGMFVEGMVDTTLVVQDPSGRWYCNDDFSEATGSNPGVLFDQPSSGFYRVWVGTYSEQDRGQIVQLSVTERGAPGGGASSTDRASPGGDGTRLVSTGTGFLVSGTGHVLTNNHVIEGCTRATFQLRGDLAVEAAILSSNTTTDLALLKTTVTSSMPAQFRGGPTVRLGDEVIVYGFPLLGDLSSQGNLTDGIVSALSGLNDDLTRMQITAQIQPGNSGGPVMDRAGRIVGVVVETANDEYFRRERGAVPQNVNFAIRDGLARSFLDTNNVDYTVAPAGGETLSVADIAERAQAFTGIILCYQ